MIATLAQGVGQVGGPLGAIAWVLGRRPLDDVVEPGGSDLCRQMGGGLVDEAHQEGAERVLARAPERCVTGDGGEQGGPERVHVGADVPAVRFGFGRGVVPTDGELGAGGIADTGDAEVGQLGPVGTEEDVGRLDVAVQHAATMGGIDRFAHRDHEIDGLAPRQRPSRHPVGQRATLDVLHDEVGVAVGGGAGVVDGDDVGMAGHRTVELALLLEELTGRAVDGRRQDLDRHMPVELRVEGLVDDAEAAAAEHRLEVEVGDSQVDGGNGHGAHSDRRRGR